jgi:hypothetical protein
VAAREVPEMLITTLIEALFVPGSSPVELGFTPSDVLAVDFSVKRADGLPVVGVVQLARGNGRSCVVSIRKTDGELHFGVVRGF